MNTTSTQWHNKVVLITGASRGIGRALALDMASRGAKIALVARSQKDLNEVLAEINGQGMVYVADVSQRDAITQAITQVSQQLGPIDVLINCAGIGAFGAFNDERIDVCEELMRVNYLSVVYAMKAALPAMIRRRQGCIVNIASVVGRIAAPLEAAYSASKYAVVGLSEAVHTEVQPYGVHVCAVLPGPVKTEFFAARGHSYPFQSPKPIAPQKVVNVVIRTIEKKFAAKFVPSWFRFAYTARVLVPALYHKGLKRMYANYFKNENLED